jgi:hypothetical protein
VCTSRVFNTLVVAIMGVKDRIKALNQQAEQSNAIAASGTSSPTNIQRRMIFPQQSSPTGPAPISPPIPTNNNNNNNDNDAALQNNESVTAAQGVEILDSAISTTSSAITHKLDKKNVQVDAIQEANESNSIPPIIEGGDNDDLEAPVQEKVEETTAAATKEAVEKPYDETNMDSLLPMTHVDPSQHDTTPDDVSSLHHSFVEEEKSKHNDQSSQQLQVLPVHHEEDSVGEYTQKTYQRRNILIIILLLVFLGLVCAIGAGIVLALKNRPPKMDANEDKYGGVGAGIDTDDLFATAFPSSAPSYEGPCIGIEVGIIFDKYATETSWKLLLGEESEEVIIWQSDYYGSNWDGDWDVFRKCFPPGMYTFVFMDKEGDGICCNHGDGTYVLSSEGKVIAIGGQMDSKEERTMFELEYVEPEPTDSNGDGLDDRLGLMMPYDSSTLIEGETCENFRLVFETDQYGIETTFELYEGSSRVSENLVANGGPYGSEETYVHDYCLASQKSYVLYMYDWKGDGLCCEYGQGWYKVTSGDITIHESDGKFGEEDVVRFVLPADGTFIETEAPVETPAPSRAPTPLPTPPPPTESPTQLPTPTPTTPPPVLTDAPSNPPTPLPPPTPPPFTLPFITFPPSAAPISQVSTQMPTQSVTTTSTNVTPMPSESATTMSSNATPMPTESVMTISTSSSTQQPSQTAITSPTLQPTNSTETKMCSFCTDVEMKKPDQALAAGQTCQSVQDKANTLTADHPNCQLLKLVEESCCRPR